MKLRWFLTPVVTGMLTACIEQQVPPTPQALPANQVAERIRNLPRQAQFSLAGIASFENKLYVASNVGLITVANGRLDTLYTWVSRDDVIEGPWVDRANKALWIQHAHDNSLARFDGRSWRRMALPVPRDGYTRGDIMTGFLGISSSNAFWLVGGGHAWRFEAATASWTQEPDAPAPEFSAIRGLAPVGSSMFYIVREGLEVTPPSKYGVYDRARKWARQNLSSHNVDFAGLVIASEGAFVRTEDGGLYLIGSRGVERQDTLGFCEAITQNSAGNLLASFAYVGVFELTRGAWTPVVPWPYEKDEGEHWAFLADVNGQVAYVTSSVPQIQPDGSFKESGTVALWIQRGTRLERVKFE